MKSTLLLSLVFAAGTASAATTATFLTDSNGQQVTNTQGQCWQSTTGQTTLNCATPTAAVSAPVETAPVAAPAQASVLRVLFPSDNAELNVEDAAKIKAAATPKNNAQITVRGYADFTGGDSRNQALARRRAEAAKRALVGKGVAANQIKIETVVPATARDASPCAKLVGAQLENCLAQDRKVEVVIPVQAR